MSRSIAIVGAGLSGLICARVLQQNGVENIVIYERESSPTSRLQGGSLDMHPESGLKAIKLAGLLDEFKAISRPEGEDTKIMDKRGNVLFEDTAPEVDSTHSRPEADRTMLRDMFLKSLAPNTIRWGCAIKSAEDKDGKIHVDFEDPSKPTAIHDFVVGADGVWSRVRPSLSPTKPDYAGVSFLDIFLNDVDSNHPDLAELIGRGMLFALGNNKAIIPQRNSNSVVRVYACLRESQEWFEESGINKLVAEGSYAEAQKIFVTRFADWSPELKKFLTVPCSTMAVRSLFTFRNHTWPCHGRMTLIGDAAHVMVVFSGDGANHAMLDGAELGVCLAKNLSADEKTFKRKIDEFEHIMLRRANAAAEDSYRNMQLFICDDAPTPAVKLMESLTGGSVQWLWNIVRNLVW